MAYLVLARKWRPQTFGEIRGQAHIVRALTNAIGSGRIAHAYLFTGIRGVGKTSAARILAKALNCEQGPSKEPCNRCPSCVEITEGSSPDVFEIDGASNTGVDDVRKLREAVRYPPVRGPRRIYIIDEVHMLSTAAFNALLKTLEEPPEHVVFVFATTDPQKVPATIISRCQQFDFKRLSARELVGLLGDVARAEGVEADEKGLAALAREAEGSVRDAQSLLDQVISYAGETLRYEDVRDVLGVVDRELVLALARAVITGDARGVVEGVTEAERFGYDARRLAHDLLDVFRDLAVLVAVDGAERLVELTPEEVGEARGFLSGVSWEAVHARFDMLGRGVEALRNAYRPGTVLEMTLLKMTRLPPLVPVSELLAGLVAAPAPQGVEESSAPAPMARARKLLDGASAPRTLPGPPPSKPKPEQNRPAGEVAPRSEASTRVVPAPPTRAPAPVKVETDPGVCPETGEARRAPPNEPPACAAPELWEAFLAELERKSRSTWNVVRHNSRLKSWNPESSQAELVYDDPGQGFYFKSKRDLLQGALAAVAGPGARLVVSSDPAVPGGSAPHERDTDRAKQIKREALEHPLVRDAVEIFDGDIEEVHVLKP